MSAEPIEALQAENENIQGGGREYKELEKWIKSKKQYNGGEKNCRKKGG